mmetsp:Transcript_71354/g.126068  ORF Transcript_71354/g.126068 Transcript_71354/m.126068 type:complete len:531 (+) Transcript_71354:71-1663(+)|eukprot:CAMPEP_0197624940 /NCGR_PEP_ID=MMETSP1338-20131121/4426_1 /TAXON_ID=43686 ORGANISM="Pelagodinium beii, Strain RCC1491" /NCGR_SAMPLE_ID=MMETSP1338 /ASSEMBLY_ACC=CAM_ASM_000754 /LENGTH=530 /DNA_ID=CAMNT_0043195203 /DNA_START=71 /DNA_END=1663 /DNA_ORIENTATION=-
MAPSKAGDSKDLVDKLRASQRSSQANKRCADCTEKGPTYICLDFQIFVCQQCSGLHREFGHKIKSISLSEWSPAEVAKIEEGGNEKSYLKWLYRWNKDTNPEPDSSDLDAVREFIRLKYVEKKWFRPYNAAEASKPAQEVPKGGYTDKAASGPRISVPVAPQVGAMDLLGGNSPAASSAKQIAQMPDLLGGIDLSPAAGTSVQAPAPPALPPQDSWTADFSNHAPEVSPALGGGIADGLIDLDFSATSAPAKACPPTPKDVDMTPAVKAPMAEPAEEPAPTQAAETEDATPMAEKLRQAVMSGSQNDLMRLFEQCSKVATPPKKAQDPARISAFSAFDELSAGGETEAPTTTDAAADASLGAAQPVISQEQPQPQHQAQEAKSADPACAGPQRFFIGDEDARSPQPAEDPIAAAFASAFASSSSAPGRADAGAISPEKIVELMPQGLASQLTPQQLQTMGAQDLMQLQMMISSALQARSQQQQVAAPPGPVPAPWQAARANSATDIEWMPSEPAKDAPFGDLLDMFNKKN